MKSALLALNLIILVLLVVWPRHDLVSEGGMSKKSSHITGIDPDQVDWRKKDDEYWKSVLSPTQYQVCRLHGTEPPFSGAYVDSKEKGHYLCSNCGLPLFSSDAKFDSGTGWPSFYEAAGGKQLEVKQDVSFGMVRNEVICPRCGAHLGHVFDDGPEPTGKRYCINSVCLLHEKDKKE